MIKKIAVGALAAAALLVVLQFTKLGSYGRTAWTGVKNAAARQVPVEFEIETVKQQVEQLVPDMKRNLSIIAEATVEVENLEEEVTTIQAKLQEQKGRILAMTRDLESGVQPIVYDGREFTRDRVAERLARDLNSYKRCETELRAKEQLLEAKRRSLETAREQLAAMKDQKRELEIQIAQLEADLKTLRLKQTQSQFALDDSRLSEIKASLAEIRNRLKYETTVAELHGEFVGDDVKVEKRSRPVSEVTREVREYFGQGHKVAAGQ
jgi:chromosome segregation ATPase